MIELDGLPVNLYTRSQDKICRVKNQKINIKKYKIRLLIIKSVFAQNYFLLYFFPQNFLSTIEMKLIFI